MAINRNDGEGLNRSVKRLNKTIRTRCQRKSKKLFNC